MLSLYPTLHRALQVSVNKLSLHFLAGSFPSPTPPAIVDSAAHLFAAVHLTGGKVGGAAVWRKSVDDIIGVASNAIDHLTFTFSDGAFMLSSYSEEF